MSHDESRARKVQTALEGNDEFSTFSIDPDIKKLKMKLDLQAEAQHQQSGRPETAPKSGMFMRLFHKMFRG
ncbi:MULTISPECIES: hypothetical protein [Corallococcus]|uniref:hypothetical protein n=1 Tax=Corallococcus TaxID=83461 RepID=UPI00117CC608|nr:MULTISPECIES: hypothetical protein [Corallococcus]NBD10238.1 hypothetical protein [Corallococcus silvisoli]TSC27464.1 hypothetical protein FOF48_18695 [Corallococcus sp. Z5C101001]